MEGRKKAMNRRIEMLRSDRRKMDEPYSTIVVDVTRRILRPNIGNDVMASFHQPCP
jgi:hypothetical protein